jgi:transposase
MRDLSRAREDAVRACTQAKQQLGGFLLRHDVRYAGKHAWTKAHASWLGTLNFGDAAAQTAFTEYLLAVQAAMQRVQRLSQALHDCLPGWRFEPVVAALQALRGVALVTAVGIVAEIGDLSRFEHPRKLMGYLGLVPREDSSGERVRRGSITKTGNSHARRLLIEAAWNYRHKARIGREALQRQEQLSEAVRATAWKAQLRLSKRYAALTSRGMHSNKACVAIARELSGFVWAVGMQAMRERGLTP